MVDGKVGLVFGELRDTGPGSLRRGTHQAEDFLQLIFIGGSRKEGSAGVHLGHDAACRPNVDGGVVGARAKEDVRSTVPQGNDFVGEGVDWDAKGSGETEICKLELPLDVNKQVLWLQIAVQDSILVAEGDASE